MSDWNADDRFFETIASAEGEATEMRAPSRLKSKVFSALLLKQAESGPLLSMTQSKACGHKLCFFEDLVRIAPVGERVKSLNICRVCHARVMGEKIENAPIYWPNCPYVRFQNR